MAIEIKFLYIVLLLSNLKLWLVSEFYSYNFPHDPFSNIPLIDWLTLWGKSLLFCPIKTKFETSSVGFEVVSTVYNISFFETDYYPWNYYF